MQILNSMADTYLEVKDAMIHRAEASDEAVSAPTPADRWFTISHGWPSAPAELPQQHGTWAAPDAICPPAAQEAAIAAQLEQRDTIGELRVEVLEAESLPNSRLQMGCVDPYALIAFECVAARTSQVRNDRSPRWPAGAPRAFRLAITCPYSALHVALLDEDRMMDDDPLGRVVVDISQFLSRTTYDCWWPLQYGMLCVARARAKPRPHRATAAETPRALRRLRRLRRLRLRGHAVTHCVQHPLARLRRSPSLPLSVVAGSGTSQSAGRCASEYRSRGRRTGCACCSIRGCYRRTSSRSRATRRGRSPALPWTATTATRWSSIRASFELTSVTCAGRATTRRRWCSILCSGGGRL